MTRPVSLWLLAGLVVAMVAAANQRKAAAVRLDPATLNDLSRRLDLAVSGASNDGPASVRH